MTFYIELLNIQELKTRPSDTVLVLSAVILIYLVAEKPDYQLTSLRMLETIDKKIEKLLNK